MEHIDKNFRLRSSNKVLKPYSANMCTSISSISLNGVLQILNLCGNANDFYGRGLLIANWIQCNEIMYYEACFYAKLY